MTSYASDLNPRFITMAANEDISGGKVTWKKAKKELDKRYKLTDDWWKFWYKRTNETCELESNYLLHVCITHNRGYVDYKYYTDKINEDYLKHNISTFYILDEVSYNNKKTAHIKMLNSNDRNRVLLGDSGFNTKEDMFRFSNFGVHTISEGGVCSGISVTNKNIYRNNYENNYDIDFNFKTLFSTYDDYFRDGTRKKTVNMLGGPENYFYAKYNELRSKLSSELEKRESLYQKVDKDIPSLNTLNLKPVIDLGIILPTYKSEYSIEETMSQLYSEMQKIEEEVRENGYSLINTIKYNNLYFTARDIKESENNIVKICNGIYSLIHPDLSIYDFEHRKPVDFEISFIQLVSQIPETLKKNEEKRYMSGTINLVNLENKYEYELIKYIALSYENALINDKRSISNIRNSNLDYELDDKYDIFNELNYATYKYIAPYNTFKKLIEYMKQDKLVLINIESKNKHSLLGYKLEYSTKDNVYYLSVADSNYPCNASNSELNNINEIKFYVLNNNVYCVYKVEDKGDIYIDNITFYDEDGKVIYVNNRGEEY